MLEQIPINWDLIKSPINWAIILLMVIFFCIVLDIFVIFMTPPKVEGK